MSTSTFRDPARDWRSLQPSPKVLAPITALFVGGTDLPLGWIADAEPCPVGVQRPRLPLLARDEARAAFAAGDISA